MKRCAAGRTKEGKHCHVGARAPDTELQGLVLTGGNRSQIVVRRGVEAVFGRTSSSTERLKGAIQRSISKQQAERPGGSALSRSNGLHYGAPHHRAIQRRPLKGARFNDPMSSASAGPVL